MVHLNIKAATRQRYDAIVVGSGISGGWAAKELTEKGLKTLLIERGREVKHIEDYPNNNLKIFNRWGNLIYEKNGYKNEFDGHANVGDQIGSEKLPVGTYYVFLIFNDGKTTDYTGILQLQY